MDVKDLSDDRLLEDMMYWFRVSRLEGGLKDQERENFKAICKEIYQRKLLSPFLYRNREFEG